MIDDDIDAPEDFEKEPAEKPSLREIWENNPALKLVAIVLAGVVLLGAYLIFSKSSQTTRSVVNVAATAKQIPGKEEVDPAYREALEATNKKTAEDAARHGGSALPVPIAIPKGDQLSVPEMPEKPKSDVLEEWRKLSDAGRKKAAKDAVDEEASPPAPANVPMVQPIRPQQVVKQDPNEAKLLEAQMRVIIGAQTPLSAHSLSITSEESLYETQKKAQEAEKTAAAVTGGQPGAKSSSANLPGAGTTTTNSQAKTIVPAGSIAYAQLMLELNSDISGPVLAQMLSGPFAGGRIIGSVTMNQNCSCDIISFSTIVKDAISYKVNAIALDENTTLAGQATEVDNHYMVRYVLPAAASFLTGYSQALAQTGQTQTATSGVGTQTAAPAPSAKQSLYAGMTTATQAIGNDLNKAASEPITVIIAKGTTMGVFFTTSVTTKDAGQ